MRRVFFVTLALISLGVYAFRYKTSKKFRVMVDKYEEGLNFISSKYLILLLVIIYALAYLTTFPGLERYHPIIYLSVIILFIISLLIGCINFVISTGHDIKYFTKVNNKWIKYIFKIFEK
jgi:hypothetical protein